MGAVAAIMTGRWGWVAVAALAGCFLLLHPIGFTGGGMRALLSIAAPAALCREMAGNILGLDGSEVAEDAAMDAIKELANVLVGSFTVRRLGADVPCALDTPTARLVDPARMNALAAREGGGAGHGGRVMHVDSRGGHVYVFGVHIIN